MSDRRFRDLRFDDGAGGTTVVSAANPLPVTGGGGGGGGGTEFATPASITDLDETAQAVSADPCSLASYEIEQSNATGVWLHLYDAAVGNVTVGTTPPTASIWLPAGDGQPALHQRDWAAPLQFSTALTAAVTLDLAGSQAPASDLVALFGVVASS